MVAKIWIAKVCETWPVSNFNLCLLCCSGMRVIFLALQTKSDPLYSPPPTLQMNRVKYVRITTYIFIFRSQSNWVQFYLLSSCGSSARGTTQKKKELLKSVHYKKPVTGSSFLSKSVVIFVVVILTFKRNEDRVTGFIKWTDFRKN